MLDKWNFKYYIFKQGEIYKGIGGFNQYFGIFVDEVDIFDYFIQVIYVLDEFVFVDILQFYYVVSCIL